MQVLGPACTAPAIPQRIEYAPVAFDPLGNIFPDVQVSLKRNPTGGCILLAANWRPYPVKVVYACDLFGRSGQVRHLFGGQTDWPVADGRFIDTLAPMDTRAYAIDAAATAGQTVSLMVAVTAQRRQTDVFYTQVGVAPRGAPGRKNILRNSSFEQCSIPGMPDYYCNYSIRTAQTKEGYRAGDTRGDCGWAINPDNAYDGDNSLRLSGRKTMLLVPTRPDVKKPTSFTFSVWVRGNGSDALRVQLMGPGVDSRKLYRPGPEWQRISQTTILTPDTTGGYFGILSRNKTDDAIFWVDAMQLERGPEMTVYER